MEKHVLVTGATGFVGNYIVQALLKSNCRVTATSANPEPAANAVWYPFVKYIPFRLDQQVDTIDYYSFFGKPDLLIHLAWEGLPNYKADFHLTENLPRHQHFLKNLIANGLRDITVTGTCLEYGLQEGALQESMPTAPSTFYGRAKDELRKYLQELQLQYSFSFKWARLFYMYGKGQSPNSLLPKLNRAIANGDNTFNMSGGQQVRDFLPIEEVAEYIITIALQHYVSGIINVCSGRPVTVQKFVEDYLASLHETITLKLGYYPYPDYEPMCFWGDNHLLKSISNRVKKSS